MINSFSGIRYRYCKEKMYKCTGCKKHYLRKSTLRRHLKYECGKEPMFTCMACPYRAYQKIHVISHLKRVHNIVATYSNIS